MLAFLARHRHRFLILFALALVVGLLLSWLICATFTASLPPLQGAFPVHGLAAEVSIARDQRGIPTLSANHRADLAVALGFVHAQDRLFQMDLLRRLAAGELSELVGRPALAADRQHRLNRYRWRAQQALQTAPSWQRELIAAYTRGVAAGRASLASLPWEYHLLGADFAPWRDEDSLLVGYAMTLQLQDRPPHQERTLAVLYDALPSPLADFLAPASCSWDAPLDGSSLPLPRIPRPDEIDLRKHPHRWPLRTTALAPLPEPVPVGSNNWAVSAARTRDGRAIVACDMHLALSVPGTWYRASLLLADQRLTGATLPGTPALIVGSNGYIAWGFTNAEADTADLVILEDLPDSPDLYRTPDGPQSIQCIEETILVKGGSPVPLIIEETIWGPIIGRDHYNRRLAHRNLSHEPGAVDLGLIRLEQVRSVPEALLLAPTFGVPAQNFMVADQHGRIGWTLLGRLPNRLGHDGRLPSSWAAGQRRWDGFLPPHLYPRITAPSQGVLWTANNRTIGEPFASRVGYSCADHGARARQIQQGLLARPHLDEGDMLEIQLDDRALFLRRWRDLLIQTIDEQPNHPSAAHLQTLRREIIGWHGRATPESVGFRLVNTFRSLVRTEILAELCQPCFRLDRKFSLALLPACNEDAIWELANHSPPHLRPLGATVPHRTQALHRLLADIKAPLPLYTQGAINRDAVRHPLSRSLGFLGKWMALDMPLADLPGARHALPRVQSERHGASQRLAVSPGREEQGYFHMPAGQSGHFLSPHYADGHDDWVKGRASPFLPGPPVHLIRLLPDGSLTPQ